MIGDRLELRTKLWILVLGQRGYFTAKQAMEIGYSYQAQKYHADQGNWIRVDRGLFRIREWRQDEDDHYAQWALWSDGTGVISHSTALAIHDLGDVSPARVHISVPRGFRRKASAVVLHWTVPPDTDIEERGGYRVTKPERAIAESAASMMNQHWLDGAIDDALTRGLTTPHRLRDAAAAIGPAAELGIARSLLAVGNA